MIGEPPEWAFVGDGWAAGIRNVAAEDAGPGGRGSSTESTEGTRARRARPSRATERRAWGGAVWAPVGDRRTGVHAAELSLAMTRRRSDGPLRSMRWARWMMRSRHS